MYPDFQCVVVTHGDKGTPHLRKLRDTNPWLDVQVYTSPPGRGVFPNCDRNIRDWAKKVGPKMGRVLVLEYDVEVRGDLRPVFGRQNYDLAGAFYLPDTQTGPNSLFQVAASKLPASMRDSACVLAPLAVLMFNSKIFPRLVDPALDPVFNLSMDSEVRFPSVVRHLGFSVGLTPGIPHVKCQKWQLPKKGEPIILHPSK